MGDDKIQPHFKPKSKPAHDALVVIYDLTEFTRFFTGPDAHRYVPQFINRVAETITVIIDGGKTCWEPQVKAMSPLHLDLEQRKFLGDGELLIWRLHNEINIGALMNRLWNFQNEFKKFLDTVQEDIPVAGMPPAIKFGIARGDLYELEGADETTQSEYIGVSINLASRLVKYCPGLSFIASTRVSLSKAWQDKAGYMRVVATQLRGFPEEIVIVDRHEFEQLAEEIRKDKFRTLSGPPPRGPAIGTHAGLR
jgi:class 3 adenylate cyclase